jgi:hypothetical protein
VVTSQREDVARCPKLSIAVALGDVGITSDGSSFSKLVSHLCQLSANGGRHRFRDLDRFIALAMKPWRPDHIERATSLQQLQGETEIDAYNPPSAA